MGHQDVERWRDHEGHYLLWGDRILLTQPDNFEG